MLEELGLTCPPRPALGAQQHQRHQGAAAPTATPAAGTLPAALPAAWPLSAWRNKQPCERRVIFTYPVGGGESPDTTGPWCCLKAPESGAGVEGGRSNPSCSPGPGVPAAKHPLPVLRRQPPALPCGTCTREVGDATDHQGSRAAELAVLINLGSLPAVSWF